MRQDKIHIGTISWKYDSWKGIVYPEAKPCNHLQECSRQYRTVEVDQWFWSLFSGDKAALPKTLVIEEYAGSIPHDFSFGIKIPSSIILTHYYKKKKKRSFDPKSPFSVTLSDRIRPKRSRGTNWEEMEQNSIAKRWRY